MALEDIRSQGILQNYEFKFCTDQAFGIMDGSIAVGMSLLAKSLIESNNIISFCSPDARLYFTSK